MFRKTLMRLALTGVLAVSAFAADVIVRVAPPRPVIETRGPAPGRGHVWVSGYHRYDGRGYVWVPGHWVVPPAPHRRWVEHRWVKRHGGWVLVEGHWR